MPIAPTPAHYHQKDPDLHRFGSATYKRRPRSTTSATESNDSAPASITSPTLDPPLVDLPISLRKGNRIVSPLPIYNFLSYHHVSPTYYVFVSAFSSIIIPKTIHDKCYHVQDKISFVDNV